MTAAAILVLCLLALTAVFTTNAAMAWLDKLLVLVWRRISLLISLKQWRPRR